MGNYKFRFADMMPNAWFYKLKDMSSSSSNKRASRNQKNNTKKNNQSNACAILLSPKQSKLQNLSHARKSYYFNRDPIANFDTFYNSLSNPEHQSQFHPDPPKKSASSKHVAKIKPRKSLLVSKQLISNSPVSGGCKCDSSNVSSPRNSFSATENSFPFPVKIESRSDESLATKSSSSVRKSNSDEKDIIIVEKEFTLAPIITSKPPKQQRQITITHKNRVSTKTEQELTMTKTHAMKSYSPAGGMKLRTKSPRIANLNINGGRKSVSSSTSTSSGSRRSNISDSFAVVKSSYNPHMDFKESMMEMIVENNIRASKDLEELLACYLSLNSDEYHDLIIKVFKQIWFDLVDMQIKNK